MPEPTPLHLAFDPALPEAQRTLPAGELVAALRGGRPVRLEGTVVAGEVDLDALTYPHKLVIHNSMFTGHLHLTEARFGHSLDLMGCDFRQGVNFFATRVDGQLKLQRVHIRRGEHPVVHHNFDQIEVGGRLAAANLTSEVPISLRQAKVGEVSFDGVVAAGGLDLQLARVEGDFFCQATDVRRPEIAGPLNLAGSHIGGQVVLDGRMFDADEPPLGPPVNGRKSGELRRRRRRARLRFFRLLVTGRDASELGQRRLILDRTHLSRLTLKEEIPDGISADGLAFDDLELPDVVGGAGGAGWEYCAFLERTRPFKRSTYLAIESWLRNRGLDQPAARVYIQMCERDLTTGHSPPLSRLVKWLLLGATIGFGARPRRLVWLFFVSFALSLWLFSHAGALVSYTERVAAAPDPLPAQHFSVILGAALRCHFPMLFFIGEPNYVPSAQTIPWLGLRYDGYALLVSGISWVLVPLFLAGLTGIVRQRR